MEPSEILILRAFLMTLSELDSLGDMQAKINQLSTLVKQNFSEAMKQLNRIISQDTYIDAIFQRHHDKLQGMYDVKPRNKCIRPLEESQKLPEMETLERGNSLLSTDPVEVYVKIFESNDSPGMSKKLKEDTEKFLSENPPAEPTVTAPPVTAIEYDPYAWVLEIHC